MLGSKRHPNVPPLRPARGGAPPRPRSAGRSKSSPRSRTSTRPTWAPANERRESPTIAPSRSGAVEGDWRRCPRSRRRSLFTSPRCRGRKRPSTIMRVLAGLARAHRAGGFARPQGPWLEAAGITAGPLFRRVNRHGRGAARSKRRGQRAAAAAGLNPATVAGHSPRSGFVTTAARNGKSVDLIVRQAHHRTERMVRSCIRDESACRHARVRAAGGGCPRLGYFGSVRPLRAIVQQPLPCVAVGTSWRASFVAFRNLRISACAMRRDPAGGGPFSASFQGASCVERGV